MLAKTYGLLPHQVLAGCSLTDWNFNLHILLAGQKAEEEAVKKARREARHG